MCEKASVAHGIVRCVN